MVKTHYADFGPTLATEALAERHAIHVGRETLRRWLMADGLHSVLMTMKRYHVFERTACVLLTQDDFIDR